MTGSLPCSTLLFEAKDEAEFEQARLTSASGQGAVQSLSLSSCTAMLLGTADVPLDDARIRGLTLFDMFLVISGKTLSLFALRGHSVTAGHQEKR